MTPPDTADDYVNPDPAAHRPGSEVAPSIEELWGACMECSWFDDGVYVPWPCSVIDPDRHTVAGITSVDALTAYIHERDAHTTPPEAPA